MQRYPNRQLLLFATLILLPVTAGGCLRSKQLSLSPGETIRGSLKVNLPGPYKIGDSIPLVLTVEARTGITYRLPELNNSMLGGLELKEPLPPKTEKLPGGSRQTVVYPLSGWQTGEYALAKIIIPYKTSANTQGLLQLAPLKVQLISVLPKKKTGPELLALDIKGIKSPLGLTPRYSLLKWFLLGGLVLGLILLLLRFLRRFVHPESAGKIPKIEPAHLTAMRRLQVLKDHALLNENDYKYFYSELSECIREYMENRFAIRALEMTTEEFLGNLTTGDYLTGEHRSVLKNILQQSDLVKFARQSPPPEEADQAIHQIEELIAATKETPIPVADGSNAGQNADLGA